MEACAMIPVAYTLPVGIIIGTVISLVLAIAGGIFLYFWFLPKANENKFTGFLGWIYQFLQFKTLVIEMLLKILYMIAAIFVTLMSLVTLFSGNFWGFLLYLVLGNLAVRVGFEFSLILIQIFHNTTDINAKMK
jgi:hypothetical protein